VAPKPHILFTIVGSFEESRSCSHVFKKFWLFGAKTCPA